MTDQKGSHAENSVVYEDWYDLNKYADEITKYVTDKRRTLGHHSRMYSLYKILYENIFFGAEQTNVARFPFLKGLFNTFKSTMIEANLSGYSALANFTARNAHSVMMIPRLKEVMTNQFKGMALIEHLNNNELNDFILKGEAAAWMKLKQTSERYREQETVSDLESGEPLLKFKVKTEVTYEDIVIDPIDPLDLYIDAMDYIKDPVACPKIVRSYISKRDLLTDKSNYPKLTAEDKQTIIGKVKTDEVYANETATNSTEDYSQSKTAQNQIEVLTYMGDYVTDDAKLLTNIKAVVVEGKIALLEYNGVDTPQIIYGTYFIDKETHRGVSPLACAIPIDVLSNECIDLFVSNLNDISKPILMYTAGSLPIGAAKSCRQLKELEYNDGIGNKPEFFSPPEISPNGIGLLQLVIDQQKDVLGLNNYMAGDTSGAVRTAKESQILFQKANARMRVETDTFSYNFLLPLISAFYSFNRELALAVGHPLDEIYADEQLAVTISTGAGIADEDGELNKLMQVLGMPAISQPIFQWCADSNNMPLAVRYIMSKFGLTDADNILGLVQSPEQIPPVNEALDNPASPPQSSQQEEMAIQQMLESMNDTNNLEQDNMEGVMNQNGLQ